MSDFINVPELFGSDVFTETTMKQRLDLHTYEIWNNCIASGTPLPLNAANSIAEGMKNWAIEKGAHF